MFRHVKPGQKPGGPPSKAKYSPMTDSELVPWGKGEKNPYKGSEKTLKPIAYKRSKANVLYKDKAYGVPFAWWASELYCMARLRNYVPEP